MPPYELGSSADPMLRKQVEGYRITRLVGKGGMGVVYEAVHGEIGQRAAVKVLFPEFSTDIDAVSRFVAEARAASKVQHAGLVKIFYSGRLEDETAYIMMEFLDGESIEDRMHRLAKEGKRMEQVAVIRTGQQIASALSAVHREDIIHRDLKPANLILVADPEIEGGERIKVVDFGIAKFDRSTTEISQTTVGRFLGTALYASPEQCQMTGAVGPKADVYSLGVLLYEMLAGKPPFCADQPGMVIGMHLFMQPAPLWQAAPAVPESLHRLIHEMLAKAPDKRPSMEQVLGRLAHVRLESPGLLRRLRRSGRAVIVTTAMVVGVGAGTLLWRSHSKPAVRASDSPAASALAIPAASPVVMSAATPAPVPAELAVDAAPALNPSAGGSSTESDRGPEPVAAASKPIKGKAAYRHPGPRHRSKGTTAAAAPADGNSPVLVPQPAVQLPPSSPVSAAPLPAPVTASPPARPSSGEKNDAKSAKDDDGILR